MTNREYFEGKMCLFDLLIYISNTVNKNYFEGDSVVCPVELLNNDKPHHCGETCEACLNSYLNQEYKHPKHGI